MSAGRKFAMNWDNVLGAIKSEEGKGNFKDERFYMPEYNKSGIAEAVIRFLPSKDTVIPYVKLMSHAYSEHGQWYINNCPKTLGWDRSCPVCEVIDRAYKENHPDAAKDIVGNKRRSTHHIANILVVNDPLHPENNGKVFLFKFGKTILDKIKERLEPTSVLTKPVMVFDYYDGANFNLIITKRKVGATTSYPNYDTCSFDSVCPIGSDDEIEKVVNQIYTLKDLVAEDKFESYDKLKAKYDRVSGGVSTSRPPAGIADGGVTMRNDAPASQPTQSKTTSSTDDEDPFGGVFDSDDSSFFDNLK